MASTSLTSNKTTKTSPTTKDSIDEISGNITSAESGKLTSEISAQPCAPDLLEDEQASSSEEWGMEFGDLIIDLDADLQKDEMKEKGGNAKSSDVRNANNNNSIKTSSNCTTKTPSNTQSSKTNSCSTKTEVTNSVKCSKGVPGNGSSSSSSGKNKSKSKKSSKSGSSYKHASNHSSNSNTINIGINSSSKVKSSSEKDCNISTTSSNCRNSKGTNDTASNQASLTSSSARNTSPTSDKNKHVDNTFQDNNPTNKSGGKSIKSGRSYKKHIKNSNSAERKTETASSSSAAIYAGKEGREKSCKTSKMNKQQITSLNSNASISTVTYVSPTTSVISTMGKNTNPSSFTSIIGKLQNHRTTTPTEVLAGSSAVSTSNNNTPSTRASAEAPIMSAGVQFGIHKKTHSLPSSMKYPPHTPPIVLPSASTQGQQILPSTQESSLVVSTTDPLSGQCLTYVVSGGKRDRSVTVTPPSIGNKKIKLEKGGKPFSNVMTPNETEASHTPSKTERNNSLTTMLSRELTPSCHNTTKRDLQTTSSTDNRTTDVSTFTSDQYNTSSAGDTSQLIFANGKIELESNSSTSVVSTFTRPAVQKTAENRPKLGSEDEVGDFKNSNITTNATFPLGSSISEDADSASRRTVGTVTYADAGVATEPESLGPCEPGTSVHLDGIVWHETESGVLVVNVTWRNRSYVGTLLDATKHDWAPPRIPDADSDMEFRVKSGRPKRQRGGNSGNGSGGDAGRKSRKSVMTNNGNGDDFKNSPSSNKRRSAKISESDACSGNDGEICTTPSKSAKRARMSRCTPSSIKQNLLKSSTSGSTAAKEATSGEGTSGSGSSACSSPVFMECPYANCKKRYNNNNALKYHEAHAHYAEDASGAEEGEKSGQDADSPVAESPKDSENMSSKSPEELVASESTGSPSNESENMQHNADNFQSIMDVEPSIALQVPFVLAQTSQVGLRTAGQYAAPYSTSNTSTMEESIGESILNCNPNQNYPKTTEKPYTNISSSHLTTSDVKTTTTEGNISPYSMTDLQTSESISLKSHMLPTKSSRSYHDEKTATYNDVMGIPPSATIASTETTSAVDSESAQAVKTLLQLQDESQDQLPGLTLYTQVTSACVSLTSISHPMQSKTAPPSSTTAPQSYSLFTKPANDLPREKVNTLPQSSGSHSQCTVDSSKTSMSPFRNQPGHGDIAITSSPLPRMSVGISSVSSSNNNSGSSQYVLNLGGYSTHSHGTVTTNPSQEGGALYTSSGVKMAKGKTVPIPTDPHQIPNASPQTSMPSVTLGLGGGNGKKTKRKKVKVESGKLQRHSPVDNIISKSNQPVRPPYKEDGTPVRYGLQDHPISTVRVKQEPTNFGGPQQHTIPPGGAGGMSSYSKLHPDTSSSSKSTLVQSVVGSPKTLSMKSEPGLKVPIPAHLPPRVAGFSQLGVPNLPRHTLYGQTSELVDSSHDQSQISRTSLTQPINKNDSNKSGIKHTESSVHVITTHATNPRHTMSPASEKRDLPFTPHPRSQNPVSSGTSHSLPGSRSITPVNHPQTSQSNFRSNQQINQDSSTPSKSQTPITSSSFIHQRTKEHGSPPPPLDRRVSMDNPVTFQPAYAIQQQLYGAAPFQYPYGFIPGYDMVYHPTQYMNDPQFQQHYEKIIQHEIQKDKLKDQDKLKEEHGAAAHLAAASSRSRLSASPTDHLKINFSKSSSPRISSEGRMSREESQRHQIPPNQGGYALPQARVDGRGNHSMLLPHHTETRVVAGASPVPSHGSYPQASGKSNLMTLNTQGISPHHQATPPPMVGSGSSRPNSEIERTHRREQSLVERPSTSVRTSSLTPVRKQSHVSKEGLPDHPPQNPEKPKPGPPPSTSVYASPTIPVQSIPAGPGTPVQYYTGPYIPPYGFSAVPGYAMYPHGAPIFPGHWPAGAAPPTAIAGPTEKHPAQSPHSVNSATERSSSGSRSPYREESSGRSRSEVRGRESGNYLKDRPSDGTIQVRKSVTPDPKSVAGRSQQSDGNTGSASPPTQRHLHTHHHIHEGFPLLPPSHHQYPYPAMTSAVMAGSDATAGLTPFPKRDLS